MKKKYVVKSTSGGNRRSVRRKRKNSNVRIIFIFILLFAIVGTVFTGFSLFNPPKETGDVIIKIEEGASMEEIAATLKENKVIRSPLAFNLYSSMFSDSSSFKAGEFKVTRPITLRNLTKLLIDGANMQDGVKITIPEGYVITQVATLLEEKGLGSREEFLKLAEEGNFDYEFLKFEKSPGVKYKLEGFIFPDTYYFFPEATNEEIIKTFLNEFNKQAWVKLKSAGNSSLSSIQILTLASIIEKEAVLDQERSTIASVFYNRLKINMKLESCATVQYALGREQFATVVTIEETNLDSPFNTYRNQGLPPGPICNPGLKSIEAAISPKDTNYLFFVAKGDGSHQFSQTYEEHLKAQENMNN